MSNIRWQVPPSIFDAISSRRSDTSSLEVRKRKAELVLMESELASMDHCSMSVGYAATILQDSQVLMLTQGRPVRLRTTRTDQSDSLQPSVLGALSFDSQKVISTFCPVGIRAKNAKYYTQYGKYWWNEYEQHGDSMLEMVQDQIFKEHNEHPDMCDEQESETQSPRYSFLEKILQLPGT